jgi:serine/threonine protein kinase
MGVQQLPAGQGIQYVQNGLQQKAINDKIDQLHEHSELVRALKPIFDKVAGAKERLTYAEMVQFFDTAAQSLLGCPLAELNQQEFMRFDFEGNSSLSFKEAAKCFKLNMLDLQKRIGGIADVPVPFKTPEQAGYQVLQVLASGGQGSVALANSSRGQVALKTYEKNNENAGTIEDLRSEMAVMKDLEKSPHIMHCYEIFQDATHFYCVDELLPGGDLCALRENASKSGVQLSETYFRGVFSQAVGALEYMHRHAMMHCDIKEPNIMFKTKDYVNPQIALIDFGMSKWSSSDGMAGGTPGYRPPETNDNNVWFPRGDVFCMGIVIFQILADKVPDETAMRAGIFTEGAQSLEQVNYFVKTRQPPWHLIKGRYPGVMPWLPKMLQKQMQNRPTAPVVLKEPWFNAVGAAPDAVMPETAFIMPEPFDDMLSDPAEESTVEAKPSAFINSKPSVHYFNESIE